MPTIRQDKLKKNKVPIGDGQAGDKVISFDQGDPNNPYLKYKNENKTLVFSSTGSTMDELDVGRGDLAYVHTQNIAASVWTVHHNLGRVPSVVVVDSAGSVLIADLDHPDANTSVITSSYAFAGKAYFN